MSIDRLCAYFGFTRMPFRRDLAPGALFRSAAHAEAVARLGWLIDERGWAFWRVRWAPARQLRPGPPWPV